MNDNHKTIKWIDCAKCLAILAVMTDHTNGILYTNQDIAYASYFSVSLFIIIAGMMSFLSNERHNLNCLQTFWHSSKKMIIGYLLANVIYLVFATKYFDLNLYIQYIFSFNLSSPFYFVLLYLQLMLVSRPLFLILKKIPLKSSWLWEIVGGIIILVICSFTTNFTNVLNVYGGGGKILGGTYLFLFYIGMLISKHDILNDMSFKRMAILSVIGGILWISWWRFECVNKLTFDSQLPFGAGFNPPSISFGTFGLITLLLSCGIFSLFENFKYTKWISNCFSWIGKHSLYIFLYHRFFLDFVICKIVVTNNLFIMRILYFSIMILGSIFIEYLILWIKMFLFEKETNLNYQNK